MKKYKKNKSPNLKSRLTNNDRMGLFFFFLDCYKKIMFAKDFSEFMLRIRWYCQRMTTVFIVFDFLGVIFRIL